MQVKRRLDYQAFPFALAETHLTFDLSPEQTKVTAIYKVKRIDQQQRRLTLNGRQLQLESVKINGQTTAYEQDDEHLHILTPLDEFTLEVVNFINPQANTYLEGLYFTAGSFCTQCEAEGFRRITYSADRPDVLSIYTVVIRAEQASFPYMLANGNPIGARQLSDGRHEATWFDPHPKPSYLFALVAGDFDRYEDSYTTAENRQVTLHCYVEKGRQAQAQHAVESLKKAMRWDEQTYGLAYDLDLYQIVATDFFNMGAMENKGLNVFNSKFVLAEANTATDTDYFNIESIIAHEYFHNWTGNRVTCRDWFQLSLKEGLTVFRDQQFSAQMTSHLATRIDQVKIMQTHQFAEDASPMAHPIRPDEVAEMNNFYTVTVYDKGAEVIRMMHNLLGAQGFRQGMDLYFARHDGQAVTCDDFVDAMAAANAYDLSQFKHWYSQAGTPVVTISRTSTAQGLVIDVQQMTPVTPGQDDKQPLVMPCRYRCLDKHGNEYFTADQQTQLVIDQAQQQFLFVDAPSDAALVLFDEFSAPVKVNYPFVLSEQLIILQHAPSGFARWQAMQAIFTHVVKQTMNNDELAISAFLAIDFTRICQSLTHEELACLLNFPCLQSCFQALKPVDILALNNARQQVLAKFAVAYQTLLVGLLSQLDVHKTYHFNPDDMHMRSLASVLLNLVMHIPGQQNLVQTHNQQAQNMSMQYASLQALCRTEQQTEQADQALQQFAEQWQHDSVVMDKWFALQAVRPHQAGLAHIDTLTQHPLFSWQNPNKVRAVFASLTQNTALFHAADGSGYTYFAEKLVQIDQINPQIASRLITPLLSYADHCPARQANMVQIIKMLAQQTLSNDLNEKITRALQSVK